MIPDEGKPACSVIIVNYNGKHLLDDCLSSVQPERRDGCEVILVDNGSSDGSAAHVRARWPDVQVIEAGANLGFAGGNNVGVRAARNDLIVLLNNDTIVQPGWLEKLLEAVQGPGVGVASSLVLSTGIPGKYYERNGSLNFLGHNIMRMFAHPENIFYGGGASLAFKRSIFGEPFDDEFFAYGEDVYLGLRCRFMGYRVVHVNGSVVKHLGGATSRKVQAARITMLQERNRLLNILLFFSAWTLVRVSPLLAVNTLAKVAMSVAGSRYSLRGLLRAYVWLLVHPGKIVRKRRAMRRECRVPEKEVTSWMTAKVTNGESAPGRLANWIAETYCRIVGLETLESLPPGLR